MGAENSGDFSKPKMIGLDQNFHKQTTTNSMIEFGVDNNKSLAWNWPNAKQPQSSDYQVKELNTGIKKLFMLAL